MKKLIINVLLLFVISFTVLNIVGLIFIKINIYKEIKKEVIPILDGKVDAKTMEDDKVLYNRYKEEYGENAPTTTLAYLRGYFLGKNNILEIQQVLLIISVLIGLSIGIIITLTKKSKVREILIFVSIGLGLVLINAIYIHLTRNLPGIKFSEGFVITIEDGIKLYGIKYTVVYMFAYIIKYIIFKNKVKELNKELNK